MYETSERSGAFLLFHFGIVSKRGRSSRLGLFLIQFEVSDIRRIKSSQLRPRRLCWGKLERTIHFSWRPTFPLRFRYIQKHFRPEEGCFCAKLPVSYLARFLSLHSWTMKENNFSCKLSREVYTLLSLKRPLRLLFFSLSLMGSHKIFELPNNNFSTTEKKKGICRTKN